MLVYYIVIVLLIFTIHFPLKTNGLFLPFFGTHSDTNTNTSSTEVVRGQSARTTDTDLEEYFLPPFLF